MKRREFLRLARYVWRCPVPRFSQAVQFSRSCRHYIVYTSDNAATRFRCGLLPSSSIFHPSKPFERSAITAVRPDLCCA